MAWRRLCVFIALSGCLCAGVASAALVDTSSSGVGSSIGELTCPITLTVGDSARRAAHHNSRPVA
eukprot:15476285-Alexandrium_andersonii.AAC.1